MPKCNREAEIQLTNTKLTKAYLPIKVMFFNQTPLRHQVIRRIAESKNTVYRNTEISGFLTKLYILLFFKRFKSVILNELYYKGLIELHGDVTLFIRAETAIDVSHLNIAASLTAKGMVYYKLYLEEAGPELNLNQHTATQQSSKLSIVR